MRYERPATAPDLLASAHFPARHWEGLSEGYGVPKRGAPPEHQDKLCAAGGRPVRDSCFCTLSFTVRTSPRSTVAIFTPRAAQSTGLPFRWEKRAET